MYMRIAVVMLAFLAGDADAQTPTPAGQRSAGSQTEARAMLEKLVGFPTVAGRDAVAGTVSYLAAEFRAAGFPQASIEVLEAGDTAGLIVRYPGAAGSAKPPVLLLAHMDVVEASGADWTHDPWRLTELDGRLYGRGVVDNKYGLTVIAQAFLRLRREGFVPDRELVIAFSGDEETGGTKTASLQAQRLRGAAFALNADAGGGFRSIKAPPVYYVQAAEKSYATFEVTARNKGGHSSSPRPDNAIYELAAALQRIERLRFPVRWNEVSLSALAAMAPSLEGELASALRAFVAAPGDTPAAAVLAAEPSINSDLRTTCVATMLRAGEGENSLANSATATVNCRIFPGETVADTRLALLAAMDDESLEVITLGTPLDSPASAVPAEVMTALETVLQVRAPGATIVPYMESGATDGVHFRLAGIPTVGVGPLFSGEGVSYNYHGNDENLPITHFADGLDHFYLLIKALASQTTAD